MVLSESDRQLRQAAAEMLAMAVLERFPTAKLVGGGATHAGFGYHFLFDSPPTEKDLPYLQEGMGRLIRSDKEIIHREMVRDNAAEMLRARGQVHRAQRILSLPDGVVDVFEVDDFRDVALAPFPQTTGAIKAFSLTHLEREPEGVLFIGGIAFGSPEGLKRHRRIQSLQKKCDHRKLGPELDLFQPVGKEGTARWLWHPKGQILRDQLLEIWNSGMRRLHCLPVTTSSFYRNEFLDSLRVTGGTTRDDGMVACGNLSVGHALLFGGKNRSYKNLPLGFSECGCRILSSEQNGLGLWRSGEKWVDQATFFCKPSQVCQVVSLALQFIFQGLKMLGFEHRVHLLADGPKIGFSRGEWGSVREQLTQALREWGCEWEEVGQGERGSGPSVEVVVVDSLGRRWNTSVVGIDLHLPRQLGLKFQDADGQMHCPVMVSFSLFGSLESFIGLLVEHYSGELPLWLAPEQVRVLPVSTEQEEHAKRLVSQLCEHGVRASADDREESLAARVRWAQLAKIPYIAVIGKNEQLHDRVAVRASGQEKIRRVALDGWIKELKQEIEAKALGGRIARH